MCIVRMRASFASVCTDLARVDAPHRINVRVDSKRASMCPHKVTRALLTDVRMRSGTGATSRNVVVRIVVVVARRT